MFDACELDELVVTEVIKVVEGLVGAFTVREEIWRSVFEAVSLEK